MTFKLTENEVKILTEHLGYKHEAIVKNIKELIENSGTKGIVLGVSGGIDSALTLSLCVEAIGCDNVLGLMMPYSDALHSQNTKEAQDLCFNMGVRYETVHIGDMVDAIAEEMRWNGIVQRDTSYAISAGEFAKVPMGNIMARVRMTVLYHYAWINNYLVAGTSNKPEVYTGYFTKWGDGACDFEVIQALLKVEVRELSKKLGVPQSIIDKAPSANLYEGQTDEEQLGFTYDELDYIIHYLEELGGLIWHYDDPKYNGVLDNIVERVGLERFRELYKIDKMTEHKKTRIPVMGMMI